MDNDQIGNNAAGSVMDVGFRIDGIEDLSVQYVNVISTNFDPAAFQVVFAQFMQPIIASPFDAERVAERGYVSAQALARFVLTPLMVEQTIQLLTSQLENYKQLLADLHERESNE